MYYFSTLFPTMFFRAKATANIPQADGSYELYRPHFEEFLNNFILGNHKLYSYVGLYNPDVLSISWKDIILALVLYCILTLPHRMILVATYYDQAFGRIFISNVTKSEQPTGYTTEDTYGEG